MKQNIPYHRDGYNFTVQYDFCPKCSYFSSCYQMDRLKEGNLPSYLNEECFDELEKIKISIWDFIKSKAEASGTFPWAKDINEITDEDIDEIEELCADSNDSDKIFAAISSILGINPSFSSMS